MLEGIHECFEFSREKHSCHSWEEVWPRAQSYLALVCFVISNSQKLCFRRFAWVPCFLHGSRLFLVIQNICQRITGEQVSIITFSSSLEWVFRIVFFDEICCEITFQRFCSDEILKNHYFLYLTYFYFPLFMEEICHIFWWFPHTNSRDILFASLK